MFLLVSGLGLGLLGLLGLEGLGLGWVLGRALPAVPLLLLLAVLGISVPSPGTGGGKGIPIAS